MPEEKNPEWAGANDTPEQSEEETFWRAFYEKLREIDNKKVGKRMQRMGEIRQQAKDLGALGKIAAAGTALFQKEADRALDDEIERATPFEQGFTLESHLRYEKDCLKQEADLAANYPAVEEKILELADLMGDPGGKLAKKLRDECMSRQRDIETEKGQKKAGKQARRQKRTRLERTSGSGYRPD